MKINLNKSSNDYFLDLGVILRAFGKAEVGQAS